MASIHPLLRGFLTLLSFYVIHLPYFQFLWIQTSTSLEGECSQLCLNLAPPSTGSMKGSFKYSPLLYSRVKWNRIWQRRILWSILCPKNTRAQWEALVPQCLFIINLFPFTSPSFDHSEKHQPTFKNEGYLHSYGVVIMYLNALDKLSNRW